MPILTDQIPAPYLNLTDFVHIARPEDLSQSDNGSSYKVTIAQLIDANDCCLSSGIYNYENQTLSLFGVSGTLGVEVTDFPIFSGGSVNCINNLYVNDIYPCVQHIFIQPIATGESTQSTIFGEDGEHSQMVVTHTESGNGSAFQITKLGVNTPSVNGRSTFQFFSVNAQSEIRYYDNLNNLSGTLFNDFQEVIMLSSGFLISTAIGVLSDGGGGLLMGNIDPGGTTSGVAPFGIARDSFLAKVGPSNGLNIVSTNDTNDSGFIAFYVNGDYEVKNGEPEIFISGEDPTKGFIGFGQNNVLPTSLMDISGVGAVSGIAGYSQLRLRTPYTPKPGGVEPEGATGDICYDNNNLYLKINAAVWYGLPLSAF
jgi:hypothetical protein